MRPTTLITAFFALAAPAFGELAVCIYTLYSLSPNQLCIHATLPGNLAHCRDHLQWWQDLQREMGGMARTPLYTLFLAHTTHVNIVGQRPTCVPHSARQLHYRPIHWQHEPAG